MRRREDGMVMRCSGYNGVERDDDDDASEPTDSNEKHVMIQVREPLRKLQTM